MTKFKFARLFTIVVTVGALGVVTYLARQNLNPDSQFESEVREFRQKREERLRAADGWLSVVALHWLNNGLNSVGSSTAATVKLPSNAPEDLGEIILKGKAAQLKLTSVEGVLVDGVAAVAGKVYDLKSDISESPTLLSLGGVQFFLLDRPNGMGVRVKDANSELRKNFKGNKWFDPDKKFLVEAEWVDSPTEIESPDILGNLNKETAPGYARFTLDGVEQKLYPTVAGDQLFFVFRDATSGDETYGAARFLYAAAPQNGKVILDFNRSYNPPCAFNPHTTCPLPPKQNIMAMAIRAGELKP